MRLRPFLASLEDATDDAMNQASFECLYVRMFDSAAPRIVQALAVMGASPGATAFHCAAGQDRTGVLAAALLLVLDGRDGEIGADNLGA